MSHIWMKVMSNLQVSMLVKEIGNVLDGAPNEEALDAVTIALMTLLIRSGRPFAAWSELQPIVDRIIAKAVVSYPPVTIGEAKNDA